MTELELRKFHRNWGIFLVPFLALQGVSGLALSLSDLVRAPQSEFLALLGVLHHGWNPLGSLYRILLSLATAVQGISGIILFVFIRSRHRQSLTE
jgi:hypothetical protein